MVLCHHLRLQWGGEGERAVLTKIWFPWGESIEEFPATSYLRADFPNMFDHNSNLNLNYFQEFTLTDDCVLQEHHEDPRLVHMTLLGENSELNQKIHVADGMVIRWLIRHHFNSTTKHLHFTLCNTMIFTLIRVIIMRFANFWVLTPSDPVLILVLNPRNLHYTWPFKHPPSWRTSFQVSRQKFKVETYRPWKVQSTGALIFHMHIHHTSCPTTSRAKSQVCIIDVQNWIEGINILA